MIKFKDILKEHSLGKLPSESLLKMKWNPITESRQVFPGEEVEDMNEESYPMDKSFAKEWERNCKILITHLAHEQKGKLGAHKGTVKKMIDMLRTVKGYPDLMSHMFGMQEGQE